VAVRWRRWRRRRRRRRKVFQSKSDEGGRRPRNADTDGVARSRNAIG
jgi:hypothetical protein